LLKYLPRERMLGTQMPTKMAWFSFPERNQIPTLRRKLRKAAAMKKYLLFMFSFGGLGALERRLRIA
jgi:hypothetical protein